MSYTLQMNSIGSYIGAVISFTLIAAVTFVAFIKKSKEPSLKLQSYICILFTFIGALVAWIAFVVYSMGGSAIISGKLLFASIPISSFPCLILNSWYIKIIAKTFGLEVHRKGIMLNIMNLGYGLFDIIRVLVFIGILWTAISVISF